MQTVMSSEIFSIEAPYNLLKISPSRVPWSFWNCWAPDWIGVSPKDPHLQKMLTLSNSVKLRQYQMLNISKAASEQGTRQIYCPWIPVHMQELRNPGSTRSRQGNSNCSTLLKSPKTLGSPREAFLLKLFLATDMTAKPTSHVLTQLTFYKRWQKDDQMNNFSSNL